MKIKTSELSFEALDWAAALADKRVMREPIRATNDDIESLTVPFTMYEVTTRTVGSKCVDAVVRPVTVTRYGVNRAVGASAPSIDFTDQDGRRGLGSADLFYLTPEEAQLECDGAINGYADDFSPTTDRGAALDLLMKERIDIRHRPAPWCDVEATSRNGTPLNEFGRDAVEAGLRCFVASRLGPEVEVPDEVAIAAQRSARTAERLSTGSSTTAGTETLDDPQASAAHAWQNICDEQGWNESSQLEHLEGFIRERGLFVDFAAYAEAAAAAENDDGWSFSAITEFKAEFESFQEQHQALIFDLDDAISEEDADAGEMLDDAIEEIKSELAANAANEAGDDTAAQEAAISTAESWVADNLANASMDVRIAAMLWHEGPTVGAEKLRSITPRQRH